jgi:hypothetical protein
MARWSEESTNQLLTGISICLTFIPVIVRRTGNAIFTLTGHTSGQG